MSISPNIEAFSIPYSDAAVKDLRLRLANTRWLDEIPGRFSKDELLSNITLYWMTETIHSSCRLYYEAKKMPLHFKHGERVRVPCAIAHFPKEAPFPPRPWIERGYNIQQWTEMPRGGHFAAAEEPALLAKDIADFFGSLRPAT
jgi:pimeloyl-ACP methyl ester carboxylesterase